MKQALIIIRLFVCTLPAIAGNPDSLLKLLDNHPQHDTIRVNLLIDLSGEYEKLDNSTKAILYGTEAKNISDSLHYKFGMQSSLNRLGNMYIDKGDFKKALEYHLNALKIREEMGQKTAVAYSYLNIGNIYLRLNENENALSYYSHAFEILKKAGDTVRMAVCLSNIGSVYSNQSMIAKAEEYYNRSLAIRRRLGDKEGISEIYSNLSIVFMDAGKYKEALAYALKSYDLCNEMGNKLLKAITLSNIGDIYCHMHEYDKAITCQSASLQFAKEIGSQYSIRTCYQLLADACKAKGDYKNCLAWFELFSQLNDSMMNTENNKKIAEMETRFETDKKQKEIELLQKDKNIRELRLSEQKTNINRQRVIIYSGMAGLGMLAGLIAFSMKRYREKKKINLGLERKNHEINLQKDEIEEKNRLISDGITYARNIQNAMLPDTETVQKNFPDSFILFLPKDVVSGDFYWLNNSPGGNLLLAAIDCTGHGVPGAFMSVMAYNLLENIATGSNTDHPAGILNELNKSVIAALHQEKDNSSVKYGMDISLLKLGPVNTHSGNYTRLAEYAGAHNPLCLVRDGKLTEIKANKTTIGMAMEKFTNHTLQLQKGDMIYLFTDGYPDQKGGPENKKFFSAPFRELLRSISENNTTQQKQTLQHTFIEWKNQHEQLDDVLVIGLRI